MAAIARALSRAFITINEVRRSQAAGAVCRGRPVRIPADADLRDRSEPWLFLSPTTAGSAATRGRRTRHRSQSRGGTSRRRSRTSACDGSFASRVQYLVVSFDHLVRHDQTVGSTVNRSPARRSFNASGWPSSSCIASTRAIDGPRRHAAIIAATTSAGPANNASTLPSRQLRTHPSRLRACGLVRDKGAIADALHPAPHRDVADHAGHYFFSPSQSVARAFTSASRMARPVSSDDASPLRFFGEVPSRNAFSVS